jgi:DNA repair protein RadC
MDLDHEQFWVLYLTNANRVIHQSCISTGGITGTVVDVRMIFSEALHKRATGIIVAHNHPSGQLRPSNNDRVITKQLVNAGKVLNINVLDHLIYTDAGYYSFADEGILNA